MQRMKTGDPIVFVVDEYFSMRYALVDLITSVGLSVESFKSAREFFTRRETRCSGLRCPRRAFTGIQRPRIAVGIASYANAYSNRIHYRPWGYRDVGPSH
jgi:hypothetical protein